MKMKANVFEYLDDIQDDRVDDAVGHLLISQGGRNDEWNLWSKSEQLL